MVELDDQTRVHGKKMYRYYHGATSDDCPVISTELYISSVDIETCYASGTEHGLSE